MPAQPSARPRQVLITGAGSGIGRGLALHHGAAGDSVCVCDLDPESARATAEAIVAAGGTASAHVMDVTEVSAIDRVIAALRVPIDLLVNNAGLQHVAPIESFDPARFRLLIDTLLTGAALVTRAVLPGMRTAGSGRIVNLGSIHSLVASPYKSAYVAAKHGLIGLTRALALETADCEITVNAVCPAYVRTALVEQQIADQAREHGLSTDRVIAEIMLAPMPKRRFIEISEIAAAIDYLASDAARNVTGQALVIDGGWTVR